MHAILELSDGSVLAMMSSPDMRIPIQYALSYPERWPAAWNPLDLARIGTLSFEEPDRERFPCLDLAMIAAEQGGTAPAVLNAADEALVRALLAGRLRFIDLPEILAEILAEHKPSPATDLDDILAADRWAREAVERRLASAPPGVRHEPVSWTRGPDPRARTLPCCPRLRRSRGEVLDRVRPIPRGAPRR
jgi:1-deoxy-D-xylulose-5-phosphate reductoisomerase